MDAFMEIDGSAFNAVDRATDRWWEMVAQAGEEHWEAVNFGIDANGDWLFMKRPCP